jgi:hypothetical protein
MSVDADSRLYCVEYEDDELEEYYEYEIRDLIVSTIDDSVPEEYGFLITPSPEKIETAEESKGADDEENKDKMDVDSSTTSPPSVDVLDPKTKLEKLKVLAATIPKKPIITVTKPKRKYNKKKKSEDEYDGSPSKMQSKKSTKRKYPNGTKVRKVRGRFIFPVTKLALFTCSSPIK